MAMNKATLSASITSRLRSIYSIDIADIDLNNDNYFIEQLGKIIAEEVIDHIVANARCNGIDSDGDTHDGVGII